MRRLIILFLIPIQSVLGQTTVHLDSCYSWARTNYPNLQNTEVWQEISSLKKENIQTSYKPKLSLNAQLSYQSDVPGIDIEMPGISIPSVSKDQYKAYAEFKQSIWDGGVSEMNTRLEDAILKSNLSQLEVEIYRLNEQVAKAFFTALVTNQQNAVLKAQKKVLLEKLKVVESGIKNGLMEKSAALIIEAEILKIGQNQIYLQSGKSSALKMLSIITGEEIPKNCELIYKNGTSLQDETINRPELELFNDQTNQLEAQMALLDKTRNPKLYGFGQAGYGKPGLNMLNNSFDSYYLLGVGVSWNAFDWKNTIRKKKVLRLQQKAIQHQEQTFKQGIQILISQQNENIIKLRQILEHDQKMISLRSEIVKAASSKLENETITAADYIQEVQEETAAKINYELHKIQLDETHEKQSILKGK